ncbi:MULTISPECIES: NAD(P)/FAD-dependent oxidoreductase [Mycobacterium]|uniref:NAD(P)/FAD-dependent oxidoreductase n=1 Tax=Mycobacterium TaxID=1763 RepID=UPI001EE380B4|nr:MULTISPECIES: NAD(P)/FAD-dependent oxidoreductase [Mycobacterium]BDE13108.1 dehydrogenase [Mycobacterium sp. 20KCMC460]GLB89577.1 dehydrogenase [Mycobacterium kiyosense]GLC02330.1 dehydrogenase [Mycobacterium kiyosense]GLC13027.1 dehydrogenase [Mycobacterium kiyosense]GLC20286.1 dehydrogenase [Mycobacterium kiyosense]
MTDRHRQIHPASPGYADASALSWRPRAVVVGAGIAGLAAATGLAERGVAVTVVEREDYLGGRVGGWTEQQDGTELAMNRGFHAFFRQYYNLRELLRRVDPQLRMLTPVRDYPLVDGAGRRDSFRGLPRIPPWNALAFALRSPTFRLSDLARIDARAAAPLAAVSVPEIYHQLDHIDAETFLKSINFPDSARHLAFEVFSRSFFAEPSQLSAGELATMFHIYFLGSSEGLIFDVANSNFDDSLWNPLRDYLTDLGVEFRLGTPVRRVETGTTKLFSVQDDSGESTDADAVVLAVDVNGLQSIVAESDGLGAQLWRTQIAGLRAAPPFVVQRLWLDRPVKPQRPAFLGTAGHPPLDNISVLERYERQAAAWAASNGGSVVELHSYAVDSAQSSGHAVRQLHRLYPETASAQVVHERILRRSDCPLFTPGTYLRRPTVATPQPGLVLAGDSVRVDLPVALMERAATTGWTAANHLLAQWGLAGHPLSTVPTRGRSKLLRSLADRQRRGQP